MPELPNPEVEIRTPEVTEEIERIHNLLKKENTMILLTKSGIECIDSHAITLIRTEAGKVVIYLEEGEWYEVKMTLTELETDSEMSLYVYQKVPSFIYGLLSLYAPRLVGHWMWN